MSVNKASRTSYLASLRQKVQEVSNPKSNTQKQDDERYWKAERDATGIGSAIIRFLPAKAGEEFPFVQMHTHGFQGPTSKWLIDNCPTSIGENCPVCKANTTLWNSGKDADRTLASSRKRKLIYISNILVVNDPKHPENNGKIFLYKYGKKIFDKIKEMIDPEFVDSQAPLDPFDAEEGVNFKLRITKQDGFPNYDKSTFDTKPTAIGSEDEIATILEKMYSLNELVDPTHFKSFDDLKKRFDMVTGVTSDSNESESSEDPFEKPELAEENPEPVKKTKKTPPKTAVAVAEQSGEDSDDFFAKLAEQNQG